MIFDVDCAIGIMNHIIDNQKLEGGKLNIFYCKHFYEADKLKKYDKDIIYYAILMLYQGGYIDAKINRLANNKQKIDYVKGLTLRGHEFCEHMKEPTVSEKVKNGFRAIGKHSLHYAETVIQECLVYNQYPIFTGRNVPISEIAHATGKNPQFIRIGLQRGILPFGIAMKNDGSSEYTYYCSDKKVWEATGYFREKVEQHD